MSDVSKLYKILRKSKVSFAELQFVINDEHVKSVDVTKSDNVFYTKYDVHLCNGELFYLSVKKPLSMLLSIIANKNSGKTNS